MPGTTSDPLKVAIDHGSNPSVALQHYVDARLSDQKASHDHQHAVERELAREARDTLSAVMAAKFESQNEWRSTMTDLVGGFMPRDSFDRQHEALSEKLEMRAKTLSDRVDAVEAQATRSAIIVGVISGMIGLLVGALIIPTVGHFIGV